MKSLITLFFIVVLATSCATNTKMSSSASNEEKTKEVLDHHWKVFQANDLEATMADYTEESVLITPDKTFKGLAEIRENFVFAFGLFPKGATTFQLDKSIVNQDVGYIIWQATGPKIKVTFGTDTFIIRNGKIVRQTYAGVAVPQ